VGGASTDVSVGASVCSVGKCAYASVPDYSVTLAYGHQLRLRVWFGGICSARLFGGLGIVAGVIGAFGMIIAKLLGYALDLVQRIAVNGIAQYVLK
jgi:hypothetical protein